MFLRNFIKRGLLEAVGGQPDYWIILNAAGWLDKGVLMESDLEELQEALDVKNGGGGSAVFGETDSPAADSGIAAEASGTAEGMPTETGETTGEGDEGGIPMEGEGAADGR